VEGLGEGRFKEERRRVGVGKGRVVEGLGKGRFKGRKDIGIRSKETSNVMREV